VIAPTMVPPGYRRPKGWLELHESGTYVRFSEAGAALFA
jgi:hypothetical protein